MHMHMHTFSHAFPPAYEWEMWSQWKWAVKDQNPSLWPCIAYLMPWCPHGKKRLTFFQNRNQPFVRCIGLVDVFGQYWIWELSQMAHRVLLCAPPKLLESYRLIDMKTYLSSAKTLVSPRLSKITPTTRVAWDLFLSCLELSLGPLVPLVSLLMPCAAPKACSRLWAL